MDNIQDLIKKAQSGDAEAQFTLATAYFAGNSVKEDKEKALTLFLKAAEQEVPPAMYNLGLMYRDGYGTERNWFSSMYWLWKAHRYGAKEAKSTIDNMRLWMAKKWRTLTPETVSLDIHREIENYKEEKYKIIDSFIADCKNRKVYRPTEFVDVDSDNGRRIIYLNIYPYPTSIKQKGLKEHICSQLLQLRASEFWGVNTQKLHGYLDASIELLEGLSEPWVADSYMSYYQMKGQYYMNEQRWDDAIVAFTDFLRFRNHCDITKFANDDEDIFDGMPEVEQRELCDSESSCYNAYVSLMDCCLQQNKMDDAIGVASELISLFKTRIERQDSWLGYWLLEQFKNENRKNYSPNLIRILKGFGTKELWDYSSPYCSFLENEMYENGIGNGYNWTREQYELIESMFKSVIPYIEQNIKDNADQLFLALLYTHKGAYMMQTRRFAVAEKHLQTALSLFKESLIVERKDCLPFVALTIELLADLYRVQNQRTDKEKYLWDLMNLFQEDEKNEDYYLSLKEKLEQK